MKLRLELADYGVVATAVLYEHAAPRVSRLVYASLEQALDTHTRHACFDGQEVYCFLPPFPEEPPLEFAATMDERLSGGNPAVHELAIMYGEVDLRHYWEEGFHGSLVGRIDEGLEAFASACGQTLSDGRTRLRVSQEER